MKMGESNRSIKRHSVRLRSMRSAGTADVTHEGGKDPFESTLSPRSKTRRRQGSCAAFSRAFPPSVVLGAVLHLLLPSGARSLSSPEYPSFPPSSGSFPSSSAHEYISPSFPSPEPPLPQAGHHPPYLPPRPPPFALPSPPSPSGPIAAFLRTLPEKDPAEVASRCLAPLLDTVVDANERLQQAGAQPPPRKAIFRLQRRPSLSIKTYLSRIVEITGPSTRCLITALIYLDRISAKEYPSSLTVHRLLLAAVMLAAKHTGDGNSSWSYDIYTRATGVPVVELKILEMEMLRMLQYDLVVPPHQLFAYGTKALQYKKLPVFRQESP